MNDVAFDSLPVTHQVMYSSVGMSVHGEYFTFRVANPIEAGDTAGFVVQDVALADSSGGDLTLGKQDFIEIDPRTFAIRLPTEVYGGQTLTLGLELERNGAAK